MIAVLDASVALKWQFQDEEATEQATELLRDYVNGKVQLIAPTLFPYEILSAVYVAISRKRISESAGYSAIKYLTSLGIDLKDFDDLIENTFYFSKLYSLSPYDCAYMALTKTIAFVDPHFNPEQTKYRNTLRVDPVSCPKPVMRL